MTACFAVRGKVASPTHHQVARKRVLAGRDMVDGVEGGREEKRRAVSLGRVVAAELSVMVVSRRPCWVGEKGSWVRSE